MPPTTRKPKRLPRTVSLPEDLVTALEQRAREIGENFSRLVEQGARKAFDLPAPELPDVGNAEGTWDRGARGEVLAAMAEIGPLWTHRLEIKQATGLGIPYVERTLRRLARDGKVFRWGTAPFGASYSGPRPVTEVPEHAAYPMSGVAGLDAWALRPAEAIWQPLLKRTANVLAAARDSGDPVDLSGVRGVLVRIATACTVEETERMSAAWRSAVRAAGLLFHDPCVVEVTSACNNLEAIVSLREAAATYAARLARDAAAKASVAQVDPTRASRAHYPPPSAGDES